jgi:hypothetical protein
VMVTTTPTSDPLLGPTPTASQVVALGQATPKSWTVPGTGWAVPGKPSVIVTVEHARTGRADDRARCN